MTARLGVLISGRSGFSRTLLNLGERIDDGSLDAEIVLVIASRTFKGAHLFRENGIDMHVIAGEIPADRLGPMLDDARVDLVLCAGYLKYVNIPGTYKGRILNIHPALLPGFGGKGMFGNRVHQAVLESGAPESGCTVHLVDETFDHGPIIVQKRCDIRPDDTAESLAARVFKLECTAYPEAVHIMLDRLSEGNADRTPASKHQT